MSNADCCAACFCLCNVFCVIVTFGKGCVDVCRCMPCCTRRSDQDSLEDTGSVDVDHPDTVVGKEHLFNAQPTNMETMVISSTAPTQAIPTRQFWKDQVEVRPN